MRHKYDTRALVLARAPLGEMNTSLMLLTPSLGLVRARAQGLRRPGAKLAAALATFAESELVLVRGAEGWRVAGAVLEENWCTRIATLSGRASAGRVIGLLLRLVAGEELEAKLFPLLTAFFTALAMLPEEAHESAEILAVLQILRVLGLDAGEMLPEAAFTAPILAQVERERAGYIARINQGITASGL